MDPERLDDLFQEAVSAMDAGELATLEGLLAQHPALVQQRLQAPGAWLRSQIGEAVDGFFKHPYLLWFLTEDAVRIGRLPANVAALGRAIIEAAKREGVTNLQEQLDSTLHFTVCSSVGRDDGRQLQLLDVLIDAGAATDGAPVQALICHNEAAAQHLLKRGATLTLPAAVCLELEEEVTRLGRNASVTDKQVALALAALNGKANGLARLLPLGVDLSAFGTGFYTHATPLHHAVWSGSLAAVKVLVEAGAELMTKDKAEQATPLGWAEYAQSLAAPPRLAGQYAEIAAYLREKGAQV